jgi:hypothetical protein
MLFTTRYIQLSDYEINYQLIIGTQNYLQVGDWPALRHVATNINYILRMRTKICSTELVQFWLISFNEIVGLTMFMYTFLLNTIPSVLAQLFVQPFDGQSSLVWPMELVVI